ncbi:MAG: hypothetical protein R3D85_09235 [Paracoccaceae bacterium]
MIPSALLYLAGAFAALALLSFMILKVGALMSDCPDGGPAARTAALSIATGYAAIGAGVVLLVGAALPFLGTETVLTALLPLGFAALALGLGFTQAIATLRDVLAPKPAARDIPAAAPVMPSGDAVAMAAASPA